MTLVRSLISGLVRPLIVTGPGVTLEVFQSWFLASGVWNNDGRWVDAASWPSLWFLTDGRINVFGVWDDAEEWT